jgi:hypothetical protein
VNLVDRRADILQRHAGKCPEAALAGRYVIGEKIVDALRRPHGLGGIGDLLDAGRGQGQDRYVDPRSVHFLQPARGHVGEALHGGLGPAAADAGFLDMREVGLRIGQRPEHMLFDRDLPDGPLRRRRRALGRKLDNGHRGSPQLGEIMAAGRAAPVATGCLRTSGGDYQMYLFRPGPRRW